MSPDAAQLDSGTAVDLASIAGLDWTELPGRSDFGAQDLLAQMSRIGGVDPMNEQCDLATRLSRSILPPELQGFASVVDQPVSRGRSSFFGYGTTLDSLACELTDLTAAPQSALSQSIIDQAVQAATALDDPLGLGWLSGASPGERALFEKSVGIADAHLTDPFGMNALRDRLLELADGHFPPSSFAEQVAEAAKVFRDPLGMNSLWDAFELSGLSGGSAATTLDDLISRTSLSGLDTLPRHLSGSVATLAPNLLGLLTPDGGPLASNSVLSALRTVTEAAFAATSVESLLAPARDLLTSNTFGPLSLKGFRVAEQIAGTLDRSVGLHGLADHAFGLLEHSTRRDMALMQTLFDDLLIDNLGTADTLLSLSPDVAHQVPVSVWVQLIQRLDAVIDPVLPSKESQRQLSRFLVSLWIIKLLGGSTALPVMIWILMQVWDSFARASAPTDDAS